MVKRHLRHFQTLRKYSPYMVVFALGAGATTLTYEFSGTDVSPVNRAVSNMQAKLQAESKSRSDGLPRLEEQLIPTPVEAPKPRLELPEPVPRRNALVSRSAALREAAQEGKLSRVRELISANVSTDVPDKNGRTALYLAASHGRGDIVRALIAAGADVDSRTNSGETPLMAAAAIGDPVIVHLLLEADATVDARDKSGATARLLAKKKGHDVVYEFIVDESQRRATAQSEVKRVQTLLIRHGYKPGKPDGVTGPRTANAIKRFQRRNKLKADGRITADLIAALERDLGARKTGGKTVRAPSRKPVNRVGKQSRAEDAESEEQSWWERATSTVETMISDTQGTVTPNAVLCEAVTDRWVQNENGAWIACDY